MVCAYIIYIYIYIYTHTYTPGAAGEDAHRGRDRHPALRPGPARRRRPPPRAV